MRGGTEVQRFSDIVGAIYDCAIEPELWPETLARLRTELRYATAVINYISHPSNRMLLGITSGIEPEWQAKLAEMPSDAIDLWGGREAILAAPIEVANLLRDMNPAANAETSRYIREWGVPQGLVDSICIMLGTDAHGQGAVAFGRHRDHGFISRTEAAQLSLYVPHIQRAVRISRLLDDAVERSTSFQVIIDSLAIPTVIVTANLHVVHHNPAAQQVLARGEPFALQRGRLWSPHDALLRRISAAVRRVNTSEAALHGDQFGMALPVSDGEIAAAHILPLHGGTHRPSAAPGAVAAIFLTNAPEFGGSLGPALTSRYGLTPAEIRLFEQIAKGRSLREAAVRLDIATSTARSQLLRVFAKTDLHRQAELVRLAASLTGPVHATAFRGE